MKKQERACVIFDMDGTLADCTHRLHHIKNGNKNWPAFFDACVDDVPSKYVVILAHFIHALRRVNNAAPALVICSARPSSHRPQTIEWLAEHKIPWAILLMRAHGDMRPDVEVKKDMLDKIRNDMKFTVLFAVDDRPEVVQMWRDNGVGCFAVEDRNWR